MPRIILQFHYRILIFLMNMVVKMKCTLLVDQVCLFFTPALLLFKQLIPSFILEIFLLYLVSLRIYYLFNASLVITLSFLNFILIMSPSRTKQRRNFYFEAPLRVICIISTSMLNLQALHFNNQHVQCQLLPLLVLLPFYFKNLLLPYGIID